MPERRLISFEEFRRNCLWQSMVGVCTHYERLARGFGRESPTGVMVGYVLCGPESQENCPIWAQLERKQPGPCSTPCTPGSTWTRPRSCATGLTR
jgi:hypothetical protein